MTTLRSLAANSAIRRAHWRALGLSEADMQKPKIAVVNSSSELAVCFAHLDGVARVVKDAIRAAGGVPFEIRTTAPSDFITGVACLGAYILAARDLVTNDIEAQVEAALLDGMVCLTSCDKTPPGHLMAAGRLNIPTVLVIGGYQPSGRIGADPVDIEDLFYGSASAALGKPGKFALEEMSEQAIRGPGVCAGMATANTMHCVVEALGMCIPGSAPVRANSEKMFADARRAGTRIVAMVEEGLTPRRILTEAAFRNAVALYQEAAREEFEAEIWVLERDRDALRDEVERQDDVGRRFAALCEAVDDYFPLGHLPVRLQLEFEALAERLGVARSWRVSA